MKSQITVKNSNFGENGTFEVEKATFGIYIHTKQAGEKSDYARYWLNILVDEKSGEDGEAAPCANSIPVFDHFKKNPLPQELAGATIADEKSDWDAWFGTDAPSLLENQMTFGEWTGKGLRIDWQAKIGWSKDKKVGDFRFEGFAEFVGVEVWVNRKRDEEKIIPELFGQRLKGWKKKIKKSGSRVQIRFA